MGRPKLAFDAREFGHGYRVFSLDAFARFIDERGIFGPGFVIDNQQGRRFSQQQDALVFADGRAVHL